MTSARRLFIRLIIFALPFAGLFGAVLGLAIYSGEAMPYRMVLTLQASDHGVIYRRKHMIPQESFAYKSAALSLRPPPGVLMLGSSRVLIFQSELLDDPLEFYNAGMPGIYMDGVATLIDSLTPASAPDVLVIGVDLFWFNAALSIAHRDTGVFAPIEDNPAWVLESTQRVIQALARGDARMDDLFARRDPIGRGTALGLDAQTTGIGYRWDGSMQSNPAYLAKNSRERPAQSYRLFPPTQAGNTVIFSNFDELDRVLTRADELGITVVGFLPPYMPEMYDFMRGSRVHGYVQASRSRLRTLFLRHKLPLFDFSDVRELGVGGEEMSDFVHPSARLAARMFAVMAREVPALRAYADPDRLEAAIAASPDPGIMFGD